MDRFLSKLDLRDIKISPEGSSFPPDADEEEFVEVLASAPVGVPIEAPEQYQSWSSPLFRPATTVAEAPPESNGYHEVLDEEALEVVSESNNPSNDVLKVSAKSRPSAVAGAIAGVVRTYGRAEVQAIGAGATNQAVKAAAIARDYLSESGIDAICIPAFIDITIDNEDRTAIRLVIEAR